MLESHNLEITRGDRRLFGGVSLKLQPGTLLRIRGSNGSGKTSLLRALSGLLLPSAGEIRWNGENIRTLREEYWRHLIHVGHLNALKDDLTATENFAMLCALSGIASTEASRLDALTRLGLAGRGHLPAKVLSQGQRRRIALARLLLGASHALWILDEPFAALDQAAVVTVRAMTESHLAAGGMIILTTHQEVTIPAPTSAELDLDRKGR